MRKLNKILTIFTIIFVLMIGIKSVYATEINNNIALSIEKEEKEYKQGDIINLEVKIASLPEKETGVYKKINTLGFNLEYDKEILEINKVYDEDDEEEYDDISAIRGWNYTLDTEENCILLTNYDLYSNLNETILRIKLKVKKDFEGTNINIKNIEASGGVGEENNFNATEDMQIEIKGIKNDDTSEETEKLYLSTTKYKIGEEDTNNYQIGDKYITRISPKTTIAEFINSTNLQTNGNISVYNANGEEETNLSELVKTGMIIKVTKEGYEDIIELKIAVTGDLNGDGEADITDLVQIRRHIQKIEIIQDELLLKAGNINEDKELSTNKDEVDITDLVQIRRYIQKIDIL